MSGVPLIKWGTDGMYGSYIIKDINPTEEVEEVTVENGGGLKSWRILLVQGRTVDITVVDDSNITPPKINTVITFTDQLSSANISYRVIGKNGRAARKTEADLIIRAEHLTNIEGSGNTITNQSSTDGS